MRQALVLLAIGLVACTTPIRTAEGSGSTAGGDDEHANVEPDRETDEDEEDSGGGFVDEALLRGASAPVALGERVQVPGTGVSMRPPEGAEPMPFGAGFLSRQQRVQFTIVVAEGGPDVLEAIRSGGNPQAPEPTDEEEVTVSGQQGRLGHDSFHAQGGDLERAWLLVYDGHRGLGVVATYEASRADDVRQLVHDSLASVEWDNHATLDPSLALGVDVGPVQGLELSHRSTANLVLITPNGHFPPEPGDVVVTVSPIPMQIPADQVESVCGQVAERLVPIAPEDLEHEGPVENGRLPGCERLGTAETRDGQRLATYAAVLFNRSMPILLTASVAADHIDQWRERFREAARTVRPHESD